MAVWPPGGLSVQKFARLVYPADISSALEGFIPVQRIGPTPWVLWLVKPIARPDKVVGRDKVGSIGHNAAPTQDGGALGTLRLERDDFSSNRHPALSFCLSMIFFGKPVPTFPDHALAVRSLPRGRNRASCFCAHCRLFLVLVALTRYRACSAAATK